MSGLTIPIRIYGPAALALLGLLGGCTKEGRGSGKTDLAAGVTPNQHALISRSSPILKGLPILKDKWPLIENQGPNMKYPYRDGRDLDLSALAAGKLGMKKEGVIPGRIEVLAYPRERGK